MPDNNSVKAEISVNGEWTIERVKKSLPQESRQYHEVHFSEYRRNLFYRRVAEIQNLIETEGWQLRRPKLNKVICSFFLTDKGATQVRRPFGILLQPFLPHARLTGRNGEKIQDRSLMSNLPRIFVSITEKEAWQLERQYGCKFWCTDRNWIYYDIPDDVRDLLPVLEFAYHKHRRNGQ